MWPKLPEYHLLIPDLPCHSKSKNVCRRDKFSIELCAEHVAAMIRSHAQDGRAHVVGLSSGGGFVAMQLARKYPELLKSLFTSGAWPLTGYRLTVRNSPRLLYSGLWALLHTPAGKKKVFQAARLGGDYYNDEVFEEVKGNMSSHLFKKGVSNTYGCDWMEEVGRAGVRMVIVAAGKGEIDSVHHARKAGQVANSQENGQASVYVVPGAAHAWNLQLPALFAKGIQCWVEQRPMPTEFEALAL